jgi:hypothetical protein
LVAIVTKRDTRFECSCCWQPLQQGQKNKFLSSPPFSAVLTIDRTLKCRSSDRTLKCQTSFGLFFLGDPHPIG